MFNLIFTQTTLLVMSIVFFSAIIKGYSGLGFSALMILILSHFLLPVHIIPINYALEIIGGIYLLLKNTKVIQWQYVIALTLGYIVFNPIGLIAIASLTTNIAIVSTSILIIILATLLLQQPKIIRTKINYKWLFPVGCLSGFLNGFASIGGIPSTLGILAIEKNVAKVRSTVIVTILLADVYALLNSWNMGYVNSQTISHIIFAIPMLFFGLWLGSLLFNSIGKQNYRTIVIYFLLLFSIFNIASVLLF